MKDGPPSLRNGAARTLRLVTSYFLSPRAELTSHANDEGRQIMFHEMILPPDPNPRNNICYFSERRSLSISAMCDRTTAASVMGSKGFVITPRTPGLSYRLRRIVSAVRKITGVGGDPSVFVMFSSNFNPLASSTNASRSTKSNVCSDNADIASAAPPTETAAKCGSRFRESSTISRMSGLSSTQRMRNVRVLSTAASPSSTTEPKLFESRF